MRTSLEVVRGRGHVFRELGQVNADVEQCKAVLAAAGFSRIRNRELGRICGGPVGARRG